MMHRTCAWLATLLLTVVAGLATAEPLPDWQARDAGGEAVRFSALAGERATVVLFWATWCPYCRALMPELQAVAAGFRSRGVPFLAVHIWDEEGNPAEYLQAQAPDLTLVRDGDAAAAAWQVQGTPTLVVLDAANQVRYARASGASPEAVAVAVRDTLTGLLAQPTGDAAP